MSGPLPGSPLVLTGMHRSGTSLVASLLDANGFHLGERLVGPGRGNPRGHFEDEELVRFHSELLQRNDPTGMALWLPPETVELNEEDRLRARALGEARCRSSPWGWKDPRTVHFLDLWREVFPQGRFLFMLRDPASVIDSLHARRDRRLMVVLLGRDLTPSRKRWGVFLYQRALDSWLAYNRKILSFVRRFPSQSLVVEIDALVRRPEPVLDSVAERLGAPFPPAEFSRLYKPSLMTALPSKRAMRAVARRPDVVSLHRELRLLATSSS